MVVSTMSSTPPLSMVILVQVFAVSSDTMLQRAFRVEYEGSSRRSILAATIGKLVRPYIYVHHYHCSTRVVYDDVWYIHMRLINYTLCEENIFFFLSKSKKMYNPTYEYTHTHTTTQVQQ